jgi:hypothetical protein
MNLEGDVYTKRVVFPPLAETIHGIKEEFKTINIVLIGSIYIFQFSLGTPTFSSNNILT